MNQATLATNQQTVIGRTSIVAANIAVTLTAGSANIDLSSATIPRNYQGHLIRVWDTGGKKIEGFVGGDGTGTVQKVYSTKALTTQNWAAQMAGFDDTTNCTYEIVKVYNAVVVASGSIAASAAQLSLVDGTAFANPSGLDLSPYGDGRHMLALYNTSGNYAAIGFIKAAGTGETLGSELLTSWTNDGTNGYETFTTSGTDITDAANTSGTANCYFGQAVTIGQLIKHVINNYTLNQANIVYRFGFAVTLPIAEVNWSIDIAGTHYTTFTATATRYLGFRAYTAGAGNFSASGMSFKFVTGPSATGVTIVNAKCGTTYNWMYKHASFDPNLAMTYKVLFVGD